MKSSLPLLASFFVFITQPAHAYEIDTHARITQQAFRRSQLFQSPNAFQSLGLMVSRQLYDLSGVRSGTEIWVGNQYYDLGTNPPTLRDGKKYDYVYGRDKINFRWEEVTTARGITAPFIADWLSRGSVREDDSNLALALKSRWTDSNALDQLDNQYNNGQQNINRFCNHFYDPIKHRGLTLAGVAATLGCGLSSTDALQWGLGSTQTGGLGSVDATRLNRFTIVDAREAQWRALTGLDANFAPRPEAQTRVGRDAYWATTFRALGDVMHLVQDMGQPQHTRNAAHPFGDAARLEDRVNKRALGIPVTTWVDGVVVTEAVSPLNYGNAAVPQFARFRHFFSTTEGAPAYGGLGLANYSNEGFFTANANFGSSTYARPDSVKALYNELTVDSPDVVFGKETYLYRRVPDYYTGVPSDEIKMTRESIFKDAMGQYAAALAGYSIDDAVVDEQVKLLIPRAVAYSAGVLDHFFRGSLEIKPAIVGESPIYAAMDHATATGFKKIRAKIRNTTPAIADPTAGNASVAQDMMNGTIVAVVRYHTDRAFLPDLSSMIGVGTCDSASAVYGPGNEPFAAGHDPTKSTDCRDGDESIATSEPISSFSLASGAETELVFTFNTNPVPLKSVDLALQIVYRGKLGLEDDSIATNLVHLSDPLIDTFVNAYDVAVVEHPTPMGPEVVDAISLADANLLTFAGSVTVPLNDVPYTVPSLSTFCDAARTCRVFQAVNLPAGAYARGAMLQPFDPANPYVRKTNAAQASWDTLKLSTPRGLSTWHMKMAGYRVSQVQGPPIAGRWIYDLGGNPLDLGGGPFVDYLIEDTPLFPVNGWSAPISTLPFLRTHGQSGAPVKLAAPQPLIIHEALR